jgi:hypothetical protein
MKGGDNLGSSTSGFSVGSGGLGVRDFGSTSVVGGGLEPEPKRRLLIAIDEVKHNLPPEQMGATRKGDD